MSGFIVYDVHASLIHGVGKTHEAAWADAVNSLKAAHIDIIKDGADAPEGSPGSWIHDNDLKLVPATRAMVDLVTTQGGNCSWGELPDGTACTREEENEGDAA